MGLKWKWSSCLETLLHFALLILLSQDAFSQTINCKWQKYYRRSCWCLLLWRLCNAASYKALFRSACTLPDFDNFEQNLEEIFCAGCLPKLFREILASMIPDNRARDFGKVKYFKARIWNAVGEEKSGRWLGDMCFITSNLCTFG